MHVKCLAHTKFSIDARYGYFYHHQAPCPVAGLRLEYRSDPNSLLISVLSGCRRGHGGSNTSRRLECRMRYHTGTIRVSGESVMMKKRIWSGEGHEEKFMREVLVLPFREGYPAHLSSLARL